MKYSLKIYIALFLGVFALSTSAIFVKVAEAPSSVIALYRLLFTTVVLLPFLIFGKDNRRELACLSRRLLVGVVLSGFFLAVHYIMWFESLRFTSVASSTVLVSLQPLFSLVFCFWFFRERPLKSSVVGCLVAIGGSFVIGWGDFQISGAALLGDILAFASAAVISLYFIVGQAVRREIGVITYSVLSYSSSVAFLLVYALLKGDALAGYPPYTWGAFLGLALVSTIGGQFVFNLLLKRVSATVVGMSVLGEPIGTCILAYFLLNESVSMRQLAGIAIILAGLSIFFFAPLLREKPHKG